MTIVVAALAAGVLATVLIARGGGQGASASAETPAAPKPVPPSIQGPRTRIGDLVYNLTNMQLLDVDNPSDAPYLVNLNAPAKGTAYLGVFVRVYNLSDKPLPSASGYLLEPEGNPVLVEQTMPAESPYIMPAGATVPAGGVLPVPGTTAAAGKIPGGLLLFPVDKAVTSNQPLNIVIHTAEGKLAQLPLPKLPKLTGYAGHNNHD